MTTPAATATALDRLAQNIAERVVAMLRDQPAPQPGELVDAATLARVLGVTRDFIYAHAVELGGRRLGDVGDGKRPRWRFDVDAARARLAASATAAEPAPSPAPERRQRARRPAPGVPLLPIRGRGA